MTDRPDTNELEDTLTTLDEHWPQAVNRIRASISSLRAQVAELENDIRIGMANIDSEVRKNAALTLQLDQMREALAELHAQVWGECPSLLSENSGGDAELDLQIRDLLSLPTPPASAMQIAAHLGCCSGYVRSTAKRYGLKLPTLYQRGLSEGRREAEQEESQYRRVARAALQIDWSLVIRACRQANLNSRADVIEHEILPAIIELQSVAQQKLKPADPDCPTCHGSGWEEAGGTIIHGCTRCYPHLRDHVRQLASQGGGDAE